MLLGYKEDTLREFIKLQQEEKEELEFKQMMEKHDKELQIQQVMKCINVSICQYPFNLYFVVCFPSGVLDYAVETLQLKRRNPMLKALKLLQ